MMRDWISAIAKKLKFSLPPLPTAPPSHLPERGTLLQVALLVLIAAIAHFAIASPIAAIYALIIWALKSAAVYRQRANPPRALVLLLTIFSFVLILLLYGGWNGQIAGISFLVLLLSLKFLEAKTLRDYYMVCIISFFVASISFLFNGSIINIILVTAYIVLVTATLLQISNPTQQNIWRTLPVAGGIIVKALPLAIILFFLFPRIQSSFGFLPSDDRLNGENTLSNSLVSGEFAESAFNNAVAFRAEFDTAIPDYKNRYWRAKVMTEENNFTWSINIENKRRIENAEQNRNIGQFADADLVSYQIVHEPSGGAFAPFLDYALEPSIGVQLADYSVFKSQKSDGVFAYRGVSSLVPNLINQRPHLKALLTTSTQPSSRIQALMQKWRSTSNNDTELVTAVFQHFIQVDYRYSLAPPALGDSPLDEFLFESKSGYCEHYASAFTTLVRWLGIPARIVVGYHGGTYNQLGNFLEVRYSDAHAWSEVWLNNQWQRWDPTAAISPDRIDFGMEALLSMWDGTSFEGAMRERALSNFLNPGSLQKTARRVREAWANVGYQWNKWVINYDFKAQQKLLSKLGFQHRNSLLTLMLLLLLGTLLLMLFYFWQLLPKRLKLSEPQKSYRHFVSSFKRANLEKDLSDTPHEFAQKAIRHFPVQAKEIGDITAHYVQIRYGSKNELLESFKQQVKAFKLKSKH